MSLLSLCRRSVVSGFETFVRPFISQCRSASTAPTIAPEEPFTRRWGYKDRYTRRGLLAHKDDLARVQVLRKYIPEDAWTEKKALFGQNDYIDILGNGEVHPANTLYNVPSWLRGFTGHEFPMLLRRRRYLSKFGYSSHYPMKWHNLNKRIRYLYRFLNKKTKGPKLTLRKV